MPSRGGCVSSSTCSRSTASGMPGPSRQLRHTGRSSSTSGREAKPKTDGPERVPRFDARILSTMLRRVRVGAARGLVLALAALVVAGCGSSSGPKITIRAALVYHLAGFSPAGPLVARRPERLSFTVDQPSGAPLTRYRTGPGPHTGLHLIIVRSDLGTLVPRPPPPAPDGRFSQDITFPSPGRYRVVIDIYPQLSGPLSNFQLFRWIDVAGTYKPKPLPPFRPAVTVDGYRFALHARPRLRAIEASLLDFTVTDPSGRPAQFTPWYGAPAPAVFFRAGTLTYFHTPLCSP